MYGLVNTAVRDLIVGEHGVEVWERVCERAGLTMTQFVAMENYPDSVTYGLVGAASEILGAPPEALLEAFGQYWMKYTAEQGYGGALEFAGSNLQEFLGNLDEMHARISLTFPELVPPSFELEVHDDGEWELHYHSERAGLAPMVVGLLRGLAERFGESVRIEHVAPEGDGGHDRFRIHVAQARRSGAA